MLPDTEWPGRAVIVLDVSLETTERGLGMYSSVSEKPTLFRAAGFGCWSCSAAGDTAPSVALFKTSEAAEIIGSDWVGLTSGTGNS